VNNSLPVAYSDLPKVLAKRRLKISDLQEKLKQAGLQVNQKSLYRLTRNDPIQKIDTRIVGAICQTCSVGIEDVITFEQPKAVLQKLSGPEQKRLDELMSKHNKGQLTAAEMREFDKISEEAHRLTIANARMLVAQRRALDSAQRSRLGRSAISARPGAQKRKRTAA
jgi:DNA-binding Xre family transcriptional regulator